MYYECKRCKAEEFRGLLPGTTCGMLLAVDTGICAGGLLIATDIFFPDGLGWWWLLAAPAIFAFALFPCSFILHLVVCTLEWMLISVFPCRECGSHWFSFGRTYGFGL